MPSITPRTLPIGAQPVLGETDLASQYPELITQYSNRNVLGPHEICHWSYVRRWWVCKYEHEWLASPRHRTAGTRNCPVCMNRVVLAGFNDVATTDPWVVDEWDPENEKTPHEVARLSNYRARWICARNPEHRWLAVVRGRAGLGNGCPRCGHHVSRGEAELFEFVRSLLPGVAVTQSNRTVIRRKRALELDIYVPVLRVAIEYNGTYFHSEKFKTAGHRDEKTRLCAEKGIRLLHVEEADWRGYPERVQRSVAEFLASPAEP